MSATTAIATTAIATTAIATTAIATGRSRRVDAIFDAAVDLPPGERTEFVAHECGDDDQLRAEVLGLVRAYHQADSVLEAPAARVAAPLLEAAAAIAGPAPELIGPFRIAREIGRGGMGRVYLGERADGQFEQRVAIKLIQHGAPGLLRRFVEERRILALLEHPSIARLVDGGITDAGLPYFAMELVEGEPIDRYCEARALDLDARLALFGAVCDAVAYAHHQLVIHRDLKPSNILVTQSGQPKLLDFGIAKLLGTRQAPEDATHTAFSAMTPEYAAPEQIRGEPVSTATDVYALGVLLYRLVAGERPYDLRGCTPAEVERIVCVDEPAKPSTRVPPRRRRRVRGDLDLIVMTALHKQPARRYQSPAALAADLQRFRDGHAILARPDSARYRVRKFVGRHRTAVAAAALLALGVGAAASRERVLRDRAEVEARKAREVESFLVGVFDVADPNRWGELEGGSVTARELLDRGARRVDTTLAGQPEVQSALRTTLGRVYMNLGLYDRAEPLLRRALARRGAARADTARAASLDLLGVALTRLDRFGDAEPLLREALAVRRRVAGDTSEAVAESLAHLATLLEQRNDFAAAEPLYREALAVTRVVHGDDAVQTASAMGNLGVLLRRRSVYAEAESLQRRALDVVVRRLGERHPLSTGAMQNLAATLQTRGAAAEAEALHRRSIAALRAALGDAHPQVTVALNNLAALVMRDVGRLDEAERLVREALALDRRTFGERHSYVAEGLRNLGKVRQLRGDFAGADSALRAALAINRGIFPAPHVRIATTLNALGLARHAAGDCAGAIPFLRQSLDQYRRLLGDAHRNTTIGRVALAAVLADCGAPAEAEQLARAALGRLDPSKGEHRQHHLSAELSLGKALLAERRVDDAEATLADAASRARAQFGDGHWRTAEPLVVHGTALLATGRAREGAAAIRAARTAIATNATGSPRVSRMVAEAVARLPR